MVISRESAHILVDSRYYADVEARTQGYQLHLLDAMHTLATISDKSLPMSSCKRSVLKASR